jgi:hypothetical protein
MQTHLARSGHTFGALRLLAPAARARGAHAWPPALDILGGSLHCGACNDAVLDADVRQLRRFEGARARRTAHGPRRRRVPHKSGALCADMLGPLAADSLVPCCSGAGA